MLAGSFRLVTARLIPQGIRPKQALVLVPLILAGCGGSSVAKAPQHLAGPGFSFEAPSGWSVSRKPRQVAASHGSDLVEVTRFALVNAYDPSLFGRVAPELETRMKAVAHESGGTLAGTSTVTAAGIRSHSYRVENGDGLDTYTFVLRGLREYQLLCRRKSSASDATCARLIATFRPS
jgi:hypothetical protein